MVGQARSTGDVLEQILQDRIFYDESGGGMTLSGGEPLAQAEFALELLRESQAAGIHTAVDTCGHGDEAALLKMAKFTDLFLYDLKFMDEQRHRAFTGTSNERILANLETLGRVHANIWIRVPIVPGLNDDPAELEALAVFASGIRGVREVNLLPYHKIGVQKHRRLGQRSPLDELPEPSPERVNEALATFQSKGLKTRVGG
jgi:pyruvate formate lyase activating enzyme